MMEGSLSFPNKVVEWMPTILMVCPDNDDGKTSPNSSSKWLGMPTDSQK